jgi:hypothetical protein
MQHIASIRTKIYDHFHGSISCQNHFLALQNEDAYVAYYNSMYLLQDTTGSLQEHRSRGFHTDPLSSCLEFWGLMQAIIIQQDAICELHSTICANTLDTSSLKAWRELRNLRNICAGHPAKKTHGGPLTRTFMGRAFGSYSSLTYECWEKGRGTSHPNVALGKLIDAYALEAGAAMQTVLSDMRAKWPWAAPNEQG